MEQLKAEIEQLKSTAVNVERFVSLARRYTDIRELTPEILRTFISKIVIHERPSRKKSEGEQRIDIYFTHIGSMPAVNRKEPIIAGTKSSPQEQRNFRMHIRNRFQQSGYNMVLKAKRL